MAIVQSRTTLLDMPAGWWPTSAGTPSMTMYNQYSYDYATIYRTQPNVRTCVEFLGRNIAQLGLHVFRRVSDTDRKRLKDHKLAKLIEKPLPSVTRYRCIEALIQDMGIYFNAYWLKIEAADSEAGMYLLRVPPHIVTVHGGLSPTVYEVNFGTSVKKFKPEQVVHFRGYNPDSAVRGLAPLETLRRVLAEEHAAGEYREYFWRNAARMGGVIERPGDAPDWSEEARARFKAEFEELYSGGENSGKTAILEEGMTWKEAAFSAQESEYLAGRKLTREECARAYHIPLPMVGILDHATFSNIKEQHKNLYQDSLGPWLAMIEGEIMLQLLPEFADTKGVYVEFNIAEKLQGSFEEQAQVLTSAVGRAWMTPDEARARMNLPQMGGNAGELGIPLNVMIGGLASPRDTAPPPQPQEPKTSRPKRTETAGQSALEAQGLDTHNPELRKNHEAKWVELLSRHYRRQEAAIVSRVPKGRKTDLSGVWWDDERWYSELEEDLLKLNVLTAGEWANSFAERLGAEVSEDRMLPWLKEHSHIQSVYINDMTRDQVGQALREPETLDAVKNVFVLALTVWAVRQAQSAVTSASNFGASEAAKAARVKTKTWRVNSSNPRPSHAAMNGETVGVGELFSNGGRWPGDPMLPAEENANCLCSVSFGR